MPETPSDDGYSRYAGRIVWPENASALTDTALCPACFTPLPGQVCTSCGLDLRHPAAAQLLKASTDAAVSLNERGSIIGRIRFDVAKAQQAYAEQRAQHPAPDAPVPAPVPIQAASPAQQVASPVATPPPAVPRASPAAQPVAPPAAQPVAPPAAQPVAPPAAPPVAEPAGAARQPKRSSVQIVLLIVGVSLVSVAAIFFLTVAWLLAGLEFRSAIVGLFTAAALATAALLRRKRLVATAEGIGALAVVLVVLDAWAIKQNDMFGLGSTDGPLYWGIALLVCAALFLGWHALSGLRMASVAGFAAAPPGLGLLAAGLTPDLDGTTRWFLLFAAAAAAALLHRFTRAEQRAERAILFAVAGISLVGAVLVAFVVEPDSDWAPLWSLLIVGLVAFTHVWVALAGPVHDRSTEILPIQGESGSIRPISPTISVERSAPVAGRAPGGAARFFASAAAALGAFALVGIAPALAVRLEDVTLAVTGPILVAVVVALSAETLVRRSANGRIRAATVSAGITAAVFAGLFALLTAGYAAFPLAQSVARGLTAAGSPVSEPRAENIWAVLALAAVGALTVLFWGAGRVLASRRRWVAWLAVVVILLLPALGGTLVVVLAGYLLLGTAALIVLLTNVGRRGEFGTFRPSIITLFAGTVAVGYLVSWASTDTWWIGSVTTVVAAFCARYLAQSHGPVRAILLSVAILLTLIAAAYAPLALTLAAHPGLDVSLVNSVAGLALATGILQLAVAIVARGALTPLERRWAFWTLLLPTIVALTVTVGALEPDLDAQEQSALLQPEPVASIVRAALLLAAAIVWILRGARYALKVERLVAAVAVAFAALLLADSLADALKVPTEVRVVVAPAVALLVVVAALVGRFVSRSDTRPRDGGHNGPEQGLRIRIALETGAALVLVPAVFFALYSLIAEPDSALFWLVLLIAALTALVAACADDGLFASRSPRRHLGWLSIVLATAALWTSLGDNGTEAVEAYVLPVAALLLVVAALIRRFGRVDYNAASSPVAALLVFVALVLALVPIAVLAPIEPSFKALAVAVVSGALLLVAGALRWSARRSSYLAAAGLAGAIGLFAVSISQSTRLFGTADQGGTPDLRFDAWLGLPALVAFAAAVLLVRHPEAQSTDTQTTDTQTTRLRTRASRVLATVALVIGLVPSALVSWDGAAALTEPLLRPLLVLIIGGLVAIAGALLCNRPRWQSFAWPAFVVGLIAVVVTTAGRLVPLLSDPGTQADARVEAWLLPAAFIVVIAATLVVRTGSGARSSDTAEDDAGLAPIAPGDVSATGDSRAAEDSRAVVATVLVIGAILSILIVELSALDFSPLTAIRIVLLAWLFAAVHVGAFWFNQRPWTVPVAWVAIAAAAAAAAAGNTRGAPDPLEIVTIPIALALLTTGWLHMDANVKARSWPWLAPGLLVLLVPSLLLDLESNPLWRVVSLGVLAIAVLVIGAVRRLQAPFLIGAVVLLIHAVAQLWPWISVAYGAIPWWLWLGAGGILLIVLAARYEQRIQNLKSIVLRISALR